MSVYPGVFHHLLLQHHSRSLLRRKVAVVASGLDVGGQIPLTHCSWFPHRCFSSFHPLSHSRHCSDICHTLIAKIASLVKPFA